MKKRVIISLVLFILLSTITTQQQIITSKFNLKRIHIENNYIVDEKDIKKMLEPIYNKNLIFLKNKQIEKLLIQDSFIGSFNIKKNTLTHSKLKYLKKNL